MDTQPILDRLRQPRPRRPDAEALRRLHSAWRATVPYENIDLQLGREITLEPEGLAEKFGARRRGGTCFQMNTALGLLLRELGFDVSFVAGAVLRAERGDSQWGNHIALIVHIGRQRWIADAGIGDSFVEPLPLREGIVRQHDLAYRVENLGPQVWRIHHHAAGTIPSWDIHTRPRRPGEFAAAARASHPALRRVFVAQRHRDGREWALRSRIVTRSGPDGTQRRELRDRREFAAVLAETFGVPLSDLGESGVETLWHKAQRQYDEWRAMSGPSPR